MRPFPRVRTECVLTPACHIPNAAHRVVSGPSSVAYCHSQFPYITHFIVGNSKHWHVSVCIRGVVPDNTGLLNDTRVTHKQSAVSGTAPALKTPCDYSCSHRTGFPGRGSEPIGLPTACALAASSPDQNCPSDSTWFTRGSKGLPQTPPLNKPIKHSINVSSVLNSLPLLHIQLMKLTEGQSLPFFTISYF